MGMQCSNPATKKKVPFGLCTLLFGDNSMPDPWYAALMKITYRSVGTKSGKMHSCKANTSPVVLKLYFSTPPFLNVSAMLWDLVEQTAWFSQSILINVLLCWNVSKRGESIVGCRGLYSIVLQEVFCSSSTQYSTAFRGMLLRVKTAYLVQSRILKTFTVCSLCWWPAGDILSETRFTYNQPSKHHYNLIVSQEEKQFKDQRSRWLRIRARWSQQTIRSKFAAESWGGRDASEATFLSHLMTLSSHIDHCEYQNNVYRYMILVLWFEGWLSLTSIRTNGSLD